MKATASGNSGQPSGTGEPISTSNLLGSSRKAASNGTAAGTSLTFERDDMRCLSGPRRSELARSGEHLATIGSPSLASTAETWCSAVLGEMNASAAISLLVKPRASSLATSSWRLVRPPGLVRVAPVGRLGTPATPSRRSSRRSGRLCRWHRARPAASRRAPCPRDGASRSGPAPPRTGCPRGATTRPRRRACRRGVTGRAPERLTARRPRGLRRRIQTSRLPIAHRVSWCRAQLGEPRHREVGDPRIGTARHPHAARPGDQHLADVGPARPVRRRWTRPCSRGLLRPRRLFASRTSENARCGHIDPSRSPLDDDLLRILPGRAPTTRARACAVARGSRCATDAQSPGRGPSCAAMVSSIARCAARSSPVLQSVDDDDDVATPGQLVPAVFPRGLDELDHRARGRRRHRAEAVDALPGRIRPATTNSSRPASRPGRHALRLGALERSSPARCRSAPASPSSACTRPTAAGASSSSAISHACVCVPVAGGPATRLVLEHGHRGVRLGHPVRATRLVPQRDAGAGAGDRVGQAGREVVLPAQLHEQLGALERPARCRAGARAPLQERRASVFDAAATASAAAARA